MRLPYPAPDESKCPPMHYDEKLRLMVPDGYDIKKNAEWARERPVTSPDLARALASLAISVMYYVQTFPFGRFTTHIKDSGSEFFKILGNNRDWDYKRQCMRFEPLGNYNYGYTAYYAGLTQRQTEAGAGLYQILSRTSKFEFYSTWFDDPEDNREVVRGWQAASSSAMAAFEAEATKFLLQLDILGPVERLSVPIDDNGPAEIPVGSGQL
jgi:hypothetical protein